jgi:peptidoglycan-associated lipoprotein
MKTRIGFNALMLALAIATLTTTGCRKKPASVTPLPNAHVNNPSGEIPAGGILGGDNNSSGVNSSGTSGIPMSGSGHAGWREDREMFKSEAVHFAYDSSAIGAAEKSKIENVAGYLKANATAAVRVEGNADERGTEEYNRALGERRALAIREQLVHSGVDAARVDTLSNGEDRPATEGHNEAAWKQNRRGEFVVLTP